MTKVRVNIWAVANDVHREPKGWGAMSGFWHTLERAREALGDSRTAILSVMADGETYIHTEDWSFSYRDPAPGSFRILEDSQ